MIWVAVGSIVLVALVLAAAFDNAAASADAAHDKALPERTAAMCEYGACRDKWRVLLDLGPKGSRFVCDHHVDAVVRENIEPEFEAGGVCA
jgi:hypothetical protein